MALSHLDYAVFTLYMGLIVLIGFWIARREKKSARHYFLAGNKLPWFAIGTSLIASSVSTEQFIGEVGFAYRYGIAVANWEWSVFPALTAMIVFFVPFYLRKRISTMPEWLERRFGPSSRFTFAVITLLSYVFINLAGVLFAGGLALHTIFGVNLWLAVIVLAAVAGAYTVAGGLASVVWTDVLQATLLLGSGLLVFFLGLHEVGGWEAMRGTGDRAHLILSADHPELPWTGMLVLTVSTHLWYYATNQYINQRVLGAKSEWDARAGIIFAGFLGIFLTLAVCFPGVIAYRLFPDLENPDQAYPRVVSHLIGPLGYGIRGLVFAGLIGAIMSTIDSLVNSCSTVLTIDFYQRLWKPSATEREMIRVGRYTAAAVLLVGVCWTPVVGRWETLFGYFQECWFFMAVPIVVVFVSALLWPRSNNFSATATLLLCIPMTLLPAILRALHVDVNSFVLAGILLIPIVIFHIAMSYVRPAPAGERTSQWIWKPDMLFLPAEEKVHLHSWHKNLILWWALVAAAYVVIYVVFW
ncbi:MAG: sodium/solute symporter [Phycisphaerales bacterium]|nr:MAG: sodium/solute symporter [Phycisphaerales bacterium]